MAKSVSFLVSFDLPENASEEEALEYVKAEVKAACGGYDPAEPMFHLDRESVTVRKVEWKSTSKGENG